MKSIKFIKDPGYVYDLLFIFMLYFNEKTFQLTFENPEKTAEGIQHNKKTVEDFGPVPEELFLFFHKDPKIDALSFMTKHCFHPYHACFAKENYGLDTVYNDLAKHDCIVDGVLRYYFKNESEDTLKQCRESLKAANALIRDSGHDVRVKSALYSFLIDPAHSIQLLVRELAKKESLLADQYEKRYKEREELQKKFDLDKLATGLKALRKSTENFESFSEIYVSFCYYSRNIIKIDYRDDYAVLLLGCDYIDTMQDAGDRLAPRLHEFGMAISEENRVAILRFIHEKKEVTIKEIEQALDMAGTNAYYHLSLMIRAGLLKTRNQGRLVLYSINFDCLDGVIKILNDYLKDSLKI